MGKKMLNQLLWTINFMRSLEIPRSVYLYIPIIFCGTKNQRREAGETEGG